MGSSPKGSSLPPLLLLVFIFHLFTCIHVEAKPVSKFTTPYLSPSLFLANYQNMLENLKIFIYQPEKAAAAAQTLTTTSVESLFHTSLLKSPFLTTNPEEAHLLYLSFPPKSSTRSISNLIRDLRIQLPYWNRTLGADHFYVSSLGYKSDRNLVELKKNSIQISTFPCVEGEFIPHKDLILPPVNIHPRPRLDILRYLAHFNGRLDQLPEFATNMLNQLRNDSAFLIEDGIHDGTSVRKASNFSLFFYGGDFWGLAEALREGCVPVVVSDRPILDLPFMDVLRWSEIAVFVGARGGVKEMKRVMESRCERGEYERMKELGVIASRHLVWNSSPQAFDAFHTVLYQLWTRRHTIRYSTRDWV